VVSAQPLSNFGALQEAFELPSLLAQVQVKEVPASTTDEAAPFLQRFETGELPCGALFAVPHVGSNKSKEKFKGMRPKS